MASKKTAKKAVKIQDLPAKGRKGRAVSEEQADKVRGGDGGGGSGMGGTGGISTTRR